MFSDILMTVDFDRTTSAPDSTVSHRNVEAIEYFMANGGIFTLNTGRSIPQAKSILPLVPVNAPVLAYNGSAAFDPVTGEISAVQAIELDLWEMVSQVRERFPDLIVEVEAPDAHYSFEPNPMWEAFCTRNGCPCGIAKPGQDLGVFVKLAIYGQFRDWHFSNLFDATPEEAVRLNEAQAFLEARYPGQLACFRPAPKAVDVQRLGVSKATGAKALQEKLGRKILVCVGDAENDVSMLRAADYAFCPADSILAGQFDTVCPCGEGAIADVIFEKLPQILKQIKG